MSKNQWNRYELMKMSNFPDALVEEVAWICTTAGDPGDDLVAAIRTGNARQNLLWGGW